MQIIRNFRWETAPMISTAVKSILPCSSPGQTNINGRRAVGITMKSMK